MDAPAIRLEEAIVDPRSFVWLLVTGEALAPRGSPGPLARPWAPTGRRRAVAPPRASAPGTEPEPEG